MLEMDKIKKQDYNKELKLKTKQMQWSNTILNNLFTHYISNFPHSNASLHTQVQ